MKNNKKINEAQLRHLLKKADTPRKEIEENLYFYRIAAPFFREALHDTKPDLIIEIGGGRGLAAVIWKLLEDVREAIVVDQRMPDTYIKLIRRLKKKIDLDYPDFFVGKLAEFEPPDGERIAVIGVHCCGSFTDELIDFAINHQFPFAVMPCCHVFKDPLLLQLAQYLNLDKEKDKSNLIDGIRLQYVRTKNYDVRWAQIDHSITPKNNILMGKARLVKSKESKHLAPVHSSFAWNQLKTHRGKRHYLNRVLEIAGEGQLASFDELKANVFTHIRLTNDRGRHFIIRFLKEPFMKKRLIVLDQFEREKAFYEKLRNFNMPVPEVILIDGSGKYLRDVFSVRHWLPGLPLHSILHELNDEIKQKLFSDLGQMLAQIHSIQFESSGILDVEGKPTTPFWGSHFDKLMEAIENGLHYLLEQLILSKDKANKINKMILKHENYIKQNQSKNVLIHGDFQPKNILITKPNGDWVITGLLEPKIPAAGDPAIDLLKIEDSIASFQDNQCYSAFYHEYGIEPEAESFRARLLAYRLAQAPQYIHYPKLTDIPKKFFEISL